MSADVKNSKAFICPTCANPRCGNWAACARREADRRVKAIAFAKAWETTFFFIGMTERLKPVILKYAPDATLYDLALITGCLLDLSEARLDNETLMRRLSELFISDFYKALRRQT